MSARLKVLLSAYACEPNKGSEPEVGWRWAMQMARFHDVTVLTRTNNQTNIEAGLRALPQDQPRPRFIYFDGGPLALRLKKTFGAVHLYYVFWQRSARAVVADLVRRGDYDLLHHVTFAGYRFDTTVFGHGVPAIWGPLGGMESIPMRLLPWRHPFTLAVEILRNAHNTLQSMPFHVLPDRAAKSSLILVSTKETQAAFARLKIDSTLFPTIGIEREAISSRLLSAPKGVLEFLFVGRVLALKGLELALQALKRSQTGARLTIVGDGPFLQELKNLTRRLDLESRVIFRGRLAREEILGMIPQFHVFLFPSLHDSGAFAVLEAMANGLPVICLDCGGPACHSARAKK
jgi:glycosyltransferase involved in cell wall biosynthesis